MEPNMREHFTMTNHMDMDVKYLQTEKYYEGFFREGKANGSGIFQDLNGGKYEGEWKDDKQHGFGKEIWNNGDETYEG
jgi:hypothetical protein